MDEPQNGIQRELYEVHIHEIFRFAETDLVTVLDGSRWSQVECAGPGLNNY